LESVSAELVTFLAQLSSEAVGPEQARARLRALAGAHPELELDLCWEHDDYGKTTHYDVIARSAGLGAVVIGFCPERALPFIARGATRFEDDDLLCVDGLNLSVQDAVERLELHDAATLTRPLVDGLLLDRALERLGFSDCEPAPELLQRALDDFRYKQGLLRADDMRAWLDRRGMSLSMLERSLARAARIHMLRAEVVDGAERYFEDHRDDFRTLALMRVRSPHRRAAECLCEARDAGSFEHALMEVLTAGGEQHSECVFAIDAELPSKHDALQGPFTRASGFEVLRVLGTTEARWEPRTRERVERLLFERWLAEQRGRAEVRWGWGDAPAAH
jgi:putative peptide maturation system protein